MSLRALQESLQSAAWTPPQRRFFEQLIAYVLPRTLLPGSGIDITQDAALGTLTFSAQAEARTLVFQYDISGDETTTLTTGTAKRTWRMPIPFTLRSAYASLTTGSSSGAVIVDVNADNSSVFGTNKLSIDQGEESSFTATTAVDLTEQLIDADVELTFDVDDDGTNAVGLKVYLVGVYAFDTELLMFGPLDDMTVGSAYSDTLSVLGGVKPYSITTPQSLPDGITVTLNGGNNTPMTISGTPTGAGLGPGTSIPFLIRATVQDAANDVYTFSQTVTITVAAVVATIDGGALPDATVGVAYSHDADATGGTGGYTYTKQAGPSWLSVNSSTGAITGTPSGAATGVTVTVRATDSEGNYDDVTDTMDVTASDPYFANVVALLNMDGSDGSTMFIDSTGLRTWTAVGNAQIDTSLGYNTGLFDGSGDRVTTPYVTADFDWWTTDFTIEAWVYIAVNTTWDYTSAGTVCPSMVGCADPGSAIDYWSFGPLRSGNGVRFYYYNGSPNTVTNSAALSDNTLQHVAMSKTSSGIYVASHGTVSGPTAVSGTPQSSTSGVSMTLGQINNMCINGHVRALRITKGVARYTSNFTPPAAPFPDS